MGGKVAQVAGTVVGFVVGASAGNPLLGASLGGNLGGMLDRMFGKPKNENPGPSLDDGINVQSAHYGIGIKQVHGTYRVAGNVIWTDKIRLTENDEELARLTFAIALCRGPIVGVLQMWVNGEPKEFPAGNYHDGARLYVGDESQLADPRIAHIEESFGNIEPPAYRGTAYIVFDNFHIDKFGNSLPTLEFEVTTSGEENVPYEDLGIRPEIQIPDPPANAWPGTVMNVISWETQDLLETFGGTSRGDRFTNEAFPLPPGQTRVGQMLSTSGNLSYVQLSKPQNDSGSLSGETFGSNDVWTTTIFRYDTPPALGVINILAWNSSGSRLASLGIGTDGHIRFYNSSDVLVATSTIPLGTGEFHRIDAFHGNGNPSNYIVKIDGVTVIDSGASSVTTAKEFISIGKSWDNAGSPAGSFNCWYGPVICTLGAQIPDGNIFATLRFPVPKLDDWPILGDATDPTSTEPISKGSYFRGTYEPPPSGNWEPVPLEEIEKMYLALSNFGIGELDDGLSYSGLVSNDSDASNRWIAACGKVSDQFNTALVYAVKAHVCAAESDPAIGLLGNVKLSVYYAEVIDDVTLGIAQLFEYDDDNGCPGNGRFEGTSKVFTTNPNTSALFTLEEANLVFPAAHTSGATFGAVSGQASIIVLHGDLGNDTEGLRIEAEDDIVLQPPHDQRRFVCQQQGVWFIYNLIAKSIYAEVHHRDDERLQPIIPCEGCDFDIDEQGRVYTTQWTQISDVEESRVVRLDPDTLEVDRVGGFLIDAATRVRVSNQSGYPILAVIVEGGLAVLILNRGTFQWGSADYARVEAPAGFLFVSMDFQIAPIGSAFRTTVLWMLASEDVTAPNEARVVRIEIREEPAVPTNVVTNITAQIPGAGPDPAVIYWDEGTDQILVGTSAPEEVAWYTVDPTTHALSFVSSNTTPGVMPLRPKSAWRRGFDGNGRLIYAYDDTLIHALSMATKTVVQTWEVEASEGQSAIPGWVGGSLYEERSRSLITGCNLSTTAYVRVYLDRAVRNDITLKEIVDDICQQVGITPGLRDTDELASILVWGYALNQRMPARAALEPLMEIYFFDGIERDGQLAFPLRGSAPVATIPEEDLAAHEENGERPNTFPITRIQEHELPKIMELGFRDGERRYQEIMVRSFREFTLSQKSPAYDTVVVMTSAEATRAVEKMHRYQWISRNRPVSSLPLKWLWLTPSDIVLVIANQRIYTCRIEAMDIAANAMLFATEMSLEAGVYHSTAGGLGQENEPDEGDPGATRLVLLDVGLVFGTDNVPGIYFAVVGFEDAWIGAEIEISRDFGSSYHPWAASGEQGIVGSATSALGDVASAWVWDYGNTVRVRVLAGETLESSTEELVQAGANRAALGQELIGFVNATLIEEGLYELSTLLRGRNGTEGFTGTHASGDLFVLMDPSATTFRGLEPGDHGQTLLYRASSIGRNEDPEIPVEFTAVFRNLMPLSPQHLSATRDGEDDILISWRRRSRFKGNGSIGYEFPLGEATEAYEIDILDGPEGAVVRTLEATEEEVEYSAADQTTDHGGPVSDGNLSVVVYQLSATVGRGYGTEAMV